MLSFALIAGTTLLHAYAAQRLARAGVLRAPPRQRAWWLGVLLLWLVFLGGALLPGESRNWRWWPEQFALVWLGLVATLTVPLLLLDLLTGWGRIWRRWQQPLLALAAALGLALYGCAVTQALRAPRISAIELALPGLPAALDGTVLVVASDLQLGAQRDLDWFAARIVQINALQPQAVLLVGDLVERGALGDPQLPALLRSLQAPRGIWAVTGNHEYYAPLGPTLKEFRAGGVRWLRNRRVTLMPGLDLVGIDDVSAAYERGGDTSAGLRVAMPQRARRATILLSHTPAPTLIEAAAARGVNLLLSGHTHGGQIWPFGYLLQLRYPYLAGRYRQHAMHVHVSRGAGSSGPRMRLWQPGELVKITLRPAPMH